MIDLQAPNINGSNDHDRLNQVVNYIDLLHRQIELGAFDSKTNTEGFSQTDSGIYAPKKYVDELYVKKNQGTDHEGEILQVNENGILSLVDMPSGGGGLKASFSSWTPEIFTWDDDRQRRTTVQGWQTSFRIATIGIIGEEQGWNNNYGIAIVEAVISNVTGSGIPQNTKVYFDTEYMFSSMDLWYEIGDPINFRCYSYSYPLYRSINEDTNFKCEWEKPDYFGYPWYSIVNEAEAFGRVYLHGIGTFGTYHQTDV